MSTELMDEHEQAERVRAWLRENGASIVTGIALALGGLFGWQWWQQNQVERVYTAATQYQAMRDAVERQDRDGAEAMAQSLINDFARSPYALFAMLQQADLQIDAGETAAARDTLARAVEQARNPALADLARVRLARVQLADGDAQGALATLDASGSDGFLAVVGELRGDALAVLGRRDEAREAYAAAVAALDEFAPGRRLVEMKLVDAGGSVAVES
jgi:predicted negative regulator of RcsB-dependent stress response